ncbi:MAG: hypothetical protein WAK19_17310 [Candidatus Cybelea sp.]
MGTSLEQTPLPVDQSGGTSQAPATRESPQDDASDDPSEEVAPVSDSASPSAAPTRSAALRSTGLRFACRHPALAGRRACDAIVQTGGDAARVARSGCNRTAPYCASDLQSAYGLTQAARNGGRGAIVAIVEAYGYPNAAGDLAVYRKNMGLASCASSTGCLKIVNQNGHTSPLPKPDADTNDDWRAQQALDLDMASAICPNCKIVLVQANSNKNADLAMAVDAAVTAGAVSVVNSYSGKEENARDAAYDHAGRAITASAGYGTGAKTPCSYAGVVCVGGTSLLAGSSARGWTERGWSGAGGCSAYVARPSWQRVKQCKSRSVVDVSAVADPATGVAVYESASGGWQQMGGTGAGAAIVASLFALGPSAARSNAPRWIWRHAGSAAYHRVGSSKVPYDTTTGWGTPNGVGGF